MATKVLMEALSPTMEEGRLVEWKKNEGDPVGAGDVLAEVETDKAVMDLVARAGGVLLKQVIAAGTTVAVTALVGIIGEQGEDVAALVAAAGGGAKAAAPKTPAPGAPKPLAPPMAAPVTAPAAAPAMAPVAAAIAATGRVKASPLARRMAEEKGLDLSRVRGSGPEGRVIVRDLDGAPASSPSPALASSAVAAAPGVAYQDVPLSQLRKTIAKRLIQSIGPIPTFYLTAEVDMERVAEAREALNLMGPKHASATSPGSKVSFNDIILKATALALRQHPTCNAWWQDDRIRYWNEVHLSMAVAIEDGLITPVIRHADRKSLREIGAEAKDLAGRARNRRLTPEEYTGGTFSVSNLGMFDIDQFTAVINPPEAGILAVGAVAAKPVAVDGQVTVRRRMRVTLSCDHRVIDGATGAAFLRTLKQMLENPLALVW